MTRLDSLCATPFHDADPAARALVLRTLADTLLFLALDGDDPDAVPARLRVLELPDDGPAALACDDEARLAAVVGGPVAHVAMPGRAAARLLAAQGVGLLVNPGAPSQMLLDAAALDWLGRALDPVPVAEVAQPGLLAAPDPDVVAVLAPALGERLADMAGLTSAVTLLRAGDRHLIAVHGADAAAQPRLAKAIAELLAFLPPLPEPVDVTFADLPLPHGAVTLRPQAVPPDPASDPPRPKGPPILR